MFNKQRTFLLIEIFLPLLWFGFSSGHLLFGPITVLKPILTWRVSKYFAFYLFLDQYGKGDSILNITLNPRVDTFAHEMKSFSTKHQQYMHVPVPHNPFLTKETEYTYVYIHVSQYNLLSFDANKIHVLPKALPVCTEVIHWRKMFYCRWSGRLCAL